jgi:hypothetical protein
MRKLTVWALLATFVVAGSALAVPARIAANATFATGSPATTNNDDSCDIGVAPAATLLLPYFEVSSNPAGETTIFTITNVTHLPQVAHVTLWTDWTFPVIDFNIFLTGYDVQSINLHDVIWRGVIAPDRGTSSTSSGATGISPRGPLSALNNANPNLNIANCGALPGTIPVEYRTRMQRAFTEGIVTAAGAGGACATAGGTHANAVGYATIDVARFCGTGLPTDPTYFATEIGFDNVFVGDYQQVNSTQNFAQGNPMVHIRAIPEGGAFGTPTNLPRTFYSRFQAGATADRRQPLPSRFAARWINGGSTDFQTWFKIWREGTPTLGVTCGAAQARAVTLVTEMLTFDEQENPFPRVGEDTIIISPPPAELPGVRLPETSRTSVANANVFAQPTNGAVAGWIYMNLDNDETDNIASQNWVIVSMRAEGRYSVDFDAAWLGNGCSPAEAVSVGTGTGHTYVIGPSANNTVY